ncbi:MAG: hypothetical protein WA871_06660 [Candidatus Acidiferrales bacterium]
MDGENDRVSVDGENDRASVDGENDRASVDGENDRASVDGEKKRWRRSRCASRHRDVRRFKRAGNSPTENAGGLKASAT